MPPYSPESVEHSSGHACVLEETSFEKYFHSSYSSTWDGRGWLWVNTAAGQAVMCALAMAERLSEG